MPPTPSDEFREVYLRLISFQKYGARTQIAVDVDRVVSIEEGSGIHGAWSKLQLDSGQEFQVVEPTSSVLERINGRPLEDEGPP